ncbi:MAG: hypothetical protein U5L45_17820 [Saprospiraceae bacterium]|nr:hypothetical protein [Saprospiraceae bacterium]
MSKQMQVVGTSDKDKRSKEQIKFQTYTEHIKTLKIEIQALKETDEWLSKIGRERVIPVDRLDVVAQKDFLLALDGHRELAKLSHREREKFVDIMRQDILDVLEYEAFDELKDIFDKYNRVNYAEYIADAEAMAKKKAVDKMNDKYDLDLDPEDDMDAIREKVQKKKMEAADREAAKEAHRQNKQKNAKQQERADKQAAAEADMTKTTKQLYVDLVKNFHPDQEIDEERRAWKTEIMKDVNNAYQKSDFLKLMELQTSLLEERENKLQDLDEERLKYFNKSLRLQIEELEEAIKKVHPQTNGNPFGRFYSPDRSVSVIQMERHIKMMKQQTKNKRNNIDYIRTLFGLKEYLKQY